MTAVAPIKPALAQSLPVRAASPMRIVGWIVIVAFLVFGVFSLVQMDLRWQVLQTAAQKIGTFFGKTQNAITFPPIGDLVYLIGLTVGVVLLGTLVAALISMPVAYIAARNTTPVRWLQYVGRAIGVVTRAIPDVVIALAVALMFALGSTIPGIIAMGIHSIGMISKLFADAIEQIDEGPVTAIKAAGGSKNQQFWAGVFPQVLPSWIATTLHRFDINLRGSVILGYAGVGGLGYAMHVAFERFNYGRGLGIALVVFIMCVVLEIVSSTIRRALLGIQAPGRRAGLGDLIVRGVLRGRKLTPAAPKAMAGEKLTVQAALKRPWTRDRVRNTAWVVAALVLIGLSIWWAQIDFGQIIWEYVGPSFASFFPPTFGTYEPGTFFEALLVTVEIAAASWITTLVFSIVIGSLAARNVAPNGIVRNTFRVLLTVFRGVPELVLAIFLIVITGLGNQPGYIALSFGGIGLLGKLIADSFEEVPNGPEVALSAAGATRLQRYVSATVPQGFPSLIGNSLYLFDTNIRSATILGIVGAGGVGYYLTQASGSMLLHQEVTTLVIMVFVVVLIVEGIATFLRRVFR